MFREKNFKPAAKSREAPLKSQYAIRRPATALSVALAPARKFRLLLRGAVIKP
jgi:hypothetical protein